MATQAEELAAWFRRRGFFSEPRDYFGTGGIYIARRKEGADSGILDPAFFLVPQGGRWSVVVTQHGKPATWSNPVELKQAQEEAIRLLT